MPLTYNNLLARVQLKQDTQDNWDSVNQVALDGELIIYAPDNTHHYARLKIGDGSTYIKNLPFIDSGTLNGKILEETILFCDSALPPQGDAHNHGGQKSLYVHTPTGKIFYWDATSQDYQQIGGVSYRITDTNIQTVSAWNAGSITSASISNHTLHITTGTAPTLSTNSQRVVTGLTAQ